MEPRFGHEFSGVRVHSDPRAADLARAVNVEAFTVGTNIVFGNRQYDPESPRGAELLAHELAHTVQQGPRRLVHGEPLGLSRASDAAEREADTATKAVVSESSASILSPGLTTIARRAMSGTSEAQWSVAFEGRTVKGRRSAHTRDVPLPDLPEGLESRVVATIQQDARTIVGEATNAFPNIGLILAIVTKWYEADEHLQPGERLFRPHLDTLLISLDAHSFNAHTTALDQLWHRFAAHGGSSQDNFLSMLHRSLSYRDYSPGPPLRGLLEHEARRADRMRSQVLSGEYVSAGRELDEAWAQNRDDVAMELVTYLSVDTLSTMAATASGRSLLDRLFFELTRGSLGADERRQADRIWKAKAERIPLAEFERALVGDNLRIFPYREPGITASIPGVAPIQARRLKEGRIWVRMPMSVRINNRYKLETDTLPLETFTKGIELAENEIVGIRLYDEGRTTLYRPALYLVQISNQTVTQTLSKIGEVVGLGAGIGVGILVEAGVEATLAARILLWADRLAMVLGTLGSTILEHRGWILENVPGGRKLIDVVEKINSVVAVYGIVRFVAGMPRLVGAMRETIQDWKAWRAAAREVEMAAGEGRRSPVNTVGASVETIGKEVDQIDASLTADQRAKVISIVGREKAGSALSGPVGSYEVGDIKAASLKRSGPAPPSGPGPAAPSQGVPRIGEEILEEEMRMASGMKQRPSPMIEAKPKETDSRLRVEASGEPPGGSKTVDIAGPQQTSSTPTTSSAGGSGTEAPNAPTFKDLTKAEFDKLTPAQQQAHLTQWMTANKVERIIRSAKHHAWPEYIGGPANQPLLSLDEVKHIKFHSLLDTILPRKLGSSYYASRSAAQKIQDIAILRRVARDFDLVEGTRISDQLNLVLKGTPYENLPF
jgi:hypothetical protein